ncbi:ABC transporter ATP-binding protein [Mesorhizobium sp. DCY119]|uniref:ABC transporter ATP-binding protein n=1 Tax=Mesorhizobium sp. DCY119 TaxID=2108445 RepID=UPI000E758783|nr:ABC transporter ATP-binding protein [Mesorhizobium sp. DCY119]RJG40475.1 ABC transporter ATP-binding protein [Mesorhizobium sp. DCY119]
MNWTEPPALEIDGLNVSYRSGLKHRQILHDLSLCIARGESYGLVGESGCGKSTAALAVARYLPWGGRITAGNIKIVGKDVYKLSKPELRGLRARSLAMVYQDPGRALNPSLTVGRQLSEVFDVVGFSYRDSLAKAAEMLRRVRIQDPTRVLEQYPHQLSGGMQQRVVIAMALAVGRDLIILDEPTTGLDATVEAEVLDLIEDLRREFGIAVLMIGHNLSVIRRMCDRVGVLYAGTLVEEGPTVDLLDAPRHPYTEGLMRCLPKMGRSKREARLDTIPGFLPTSSIIAPGCVYADRCGLADELCRTVVPPMVDLSGRQSRCHHHAQTPQLPRNALDATRQSRTLDPKILVSIKDLRKTYGPESHGVKVLNGISLEIRAGETLGLVGESGSGKSTLARILLGLTGPDAGSEVVFDDAPLPALAGRRSQEQVRAIQMVFQNPDSALNRAHRIQTILLRPLTRLAGITGSQALQQIGNLFEAVRLNPHYMRSRPRQLSGGLKQRVAIARAFAGNPRLVVCDEPTSALDVSVQAAILNLLADLQAEQNVAYLFVSHDLKVVRYLSDRIAVLYRGRVVESGSSEQVFSGPNHPYTASLLAAGSEDRQHGQYDVQTNMLGEDSPGCCFESRCSHSLAGMCDVAAPQSREVEDGHFIACHLAQLPHGRANDGRVREQA